jgi:hypothetical protein
MRGFLFKLLYPLFPRAQINSGFMSSLFKGTIKFSFRITTLLYSGHLHGWNDKDFHSRCDSKGRTVSLFQIQHGDCIGGYTSQHWDDNGWKADSSAFLFNLTRSRHFPSKATGKDIYCHSYLGPCFSGGDWCDLSAYTEPFNGKDNCRSWANQPGYNIPLVDGKNQLTNQADGKFTITELEVWLVEEI